VGPLAYAAEYLPEDEPLLAARANAADLGGTEPVLPAVGATLGDLDEAALMRILLEPKNAIVKQYQKYFELEKVRLKFTDDATAAIAREALKRGTGARGLRAILEDVMLDVMYDLPSIPGLTECVITRDAILGTERPILVTERKAESA